MLWQDRKSLIYLIPILVAVLTVSAGIWRYGYVQQLDQLSRRGMAEVSLVLDGLAAELQRYRDQAVLLAEHPVLMELTTNPGKKDQANSLLLAASDRTDAAAIFFVTETGRILAGSHDIGTSSLGAVYFDRAFDGALGSGHDSDIRLGGRLFYFAMPAFGPSGKVNAAVVIFAAAENIEIGWRGNQTAIYLIDEDNSVFMTNRNELRSWDDQPLASKRVQRGGNALNILGRGQDTHEIWHLNLGPYLPEHALHLSQSRPAIGMTGEALIDTAPASQIAWLQSSVAGTALLFLGSLLYLAQVRRLTLARANAELENRVSERTATLTETNLALRREVRERQEAEAALKQAQAELVQAGKLSALGQMSAGISHELNQPLMAIQQFAANGEAFLSRGEAGKAGANLGRIDEMARRMSRIIRNLRAFARNENEPMGRVDIVKVTDAALELTGVRLRQEGVAVAWASPSVPVWVHGGEVRLEQVLVNLITNALDAMRDSAEKHLEIDIEPGVPVIVRVRDTGPGIEAPEKIFEPFYSTKQVGSSEGMGLGLSISYGLVQSFGGNIRGANTDQGAEFSVELEPWAEDQVA